MSKEQLNEKTSTPSSSIDDDKTLNNIVETLKDINFKDDHTPSPPNDDDDDTEKKTKRKIFQLYRDTGINSLSKIEISEGLKLLNSLQNVESLHELYEKGDLDVFKHPITKQLVFHVRVDVNTDANGKSTSSGQGLDLIKQDLDERQKKYQNWVFRMKFAGDIEQIKKMYKKMDDDDASASSSQPQVPPQVPNS